MPLFQRLGESAAGMNWGRTPIVLVVVLIHLLVLSLFWHALHRPLPHRTNGQIARVDRSQTIVFLLAPYAPSLVKPRPDEARLASRPQHADRVNAATVPQPVYGSAVSNAAALSSASSVPMTTGDGAATPSAGSASTEVSGPRLNLTLSREALKTAAAPGLAARSPFQGRLPVTVERKIAEAAAETGPWIEERIDADHFRLRRGTSCVILSRPQIATIDPFNDALRRLPWGASLPSECR